MRFDEIASQAARVGALYCERFAIAPDEAFFLGKLAEELGEVSAATFKLTGRSRGADVRWQSLRRICVRRWPIFLASS